MRPAASHDDSWYNLGRDASFYVTSLVSVLSVYSLYSAAKIQSKINRTRYKLSIIEDKPVYTPTELLMELKPAPKDHKHFRPIVEDGKIVGYRGDVFVKGIVQGLEDQPIITYRKEGLFGSEKVELIALLRCQSDIFSNDAGSPDRSKYKINLRRILEDCKLDYQKEFAVRDHKNFVTVRNYDKINYEKSLELLSSKDQKRSLQIHEFLFTLGLLGVKFIAELFFKDVNVDTFRGINVGVRDSEIGIKIGSGIAVIGEVIYDMEKGTLRIDHPDLILNERLTFLRSMREELDALLYNRNILLLLGVFGGLYAGRQFLKYLHRIKKLPAFLENWFGK